MISACERATTACKNNVAGLAASIIKAVHLATVCIWAYGFELNQAIEQFCFSPNFLLRNMKWTVCIKKEGRWLYQSVGPSRMPMG